MKSGLVAEIERNNQIRQNYWFMVRRTITNDSRVNNATT